MTKAQQNHLGNQSRSSLTDTVSKPQGGNSVKREHITAFLCTLFYLFTTPDASETPNVGLIQLLCPFPSSGWNSIVFIVAGSLYN